jgi:hypothetical protein
MKGIRKVEQNLYLEIFTVQRAPLGQTYLPQSSSQQDLETASKKEAEESRIKKLERLIKKRL